MKYFEPEIDSEFHVKIMLCFILDKLDKPVSSEHLYEIVQSSEVINYFYYAPALAELIKQGSVADESGMLTLTEKGRMSSEYFNDYIPEYFHKKLLKSAYSLFSRITRESETVTNITPVKNGFEVECIIKDVSFDLMRLTLYAPNEKQAETVKSSILANPALFYQNVVGYAVENKAEEHSVEHG